jgi:hypothetical protein
MKFFSFISSPGSLSLASCRCGREFCTGNLATGEIKFCNSQMEFIHWEWYDSLGKKNESKAMPTSLIFLTLRGLDVGKMTENL